MQRSVNEDLWVVCISVCELSVQCCESANLDTSCVFHGFQPKCYVRAIRGH